MPPRNPSRFLPPLPLVAPLAALAIIVTWSYRDGGFQARSWYAGGIVLGILVVVQLLGGFLDLSWGYRTATALALALFAAFQVLSIAWAHAKAASWDAGNRTFVYVLIFLLLGGAQLSARARRRLTLLLVLALAVVGVITLFAAADNPVGAFVLGRLAAPTGYPNATS